MRYFLVGIGVNKGCLEGDYQTPSEIKKEYAKRFGTPALYSLRYCWSETKKRYLYSTVSVPRKYKKREGIERNK